MTKPTLLKEVPIFTTGGACEKPIAERFRNDFPSIAERFDEWMSWCSFNSNTENAVDLIRSWLRKQPENNQELVTTEQAQKIAKEALADFIKSKKLFTLEEVEAIAREAVENHEIMYERFLDDFTSYVTFNDVWWANKKKELSK